MGDSAVLGENVTNYHEEARRQLFDNSIVLSQEWPFPTIIGCYLIFTFFGNRMMDKRKPFNPKLQMMAYNIFQIFYNLNMLYKCMEPQIISYWLGHMCHPMDPSKNKLWPKGYAIGYLFFLSKQIDLIDTVFMVLRKKVQQVSLLHLYHHVSMSALAWIIIKYSGKLQEQLYVIVVSNSFTHSIMYVYYFLSGLDPSIRKYLWWKKYVTMLQLVQFVIYIVHGVALLVYGCTHSKKMSMMVLFQGTVFLTMFRNFYVEHYKRLSLSEVESSAIGKNTKNPFKSS